MIITEIKNTPSIPSLKQVVAYARVSTSKEATLHSLAAQVSHYKELIQNNKAWKFIEVYSDEGITGTKETRDNFVRMINDARNGRFDLILTKSISRFARNTVTLLNTVRELKQLGIDVFFEEQNIHTLSSDGEFMLTILASYAQEESLSVSENMKWRIKKDFEEGIPWSGRMLGYKKEGTRLIAIPSEVIIVKKIFALYLEGNGLLKISKILNKEGYHSIQNKRYSPSSIREILTNDTYTGNLLLQKTYRNNHIDKKTLINQGQKTKFMVNNAHEVIIPLDTFNQVQDRINSQRAKYEIPNEPTKHPLSKLVICGCCGKSYKYRKRKNYSSIWLCQTIKTMGKEYCSSHQIPDAILLSITASILEVDEVTSNNVAVLKNIQVFNDNLLIYNFKDGTIKRANWSYPSRSLSWTPEMKEKARRKALGQVYGK